MSHYRYLKSAHVGDLMNGVFRFGSLHNYRVMEVLYGKEEIGDVTEGVARLLIGHAVIDSSTPSHELDRLRPVIDVGPDFSGRLEITDVTNHQQTEAFVLSLATGDDRDLRSVFYGEKINYDACIEFKNPDAIAAAIFETGIFLDENIPVKECFSDISFSSIKYEELNRPIESGYFGASASRKALKYSGQAESRFILKAKDGSLYYRDNIKILCKAAVDHLSIIDINPVPPASAADAKPAAHFSADEAEALLRSVREAERATDHMPDGRKRQYTQCFLPIASAYADLKASGRVSRNLERKLLCYYPNSYHHCIATAFGEIVQRMRETDGPFEII